MHRRIGTWCWVGWLCVLFAGLAGCKCRKASTPTPRTFRNPPRPLKPQRYQPPPARLPSGVMMFPEEIWVNGGSFVMGSSSEEKGHMKQESPRHDVSLSRMIAMWRNEVTQEEFKTVMGYNPSRFQNCGKRCPVEQVTWHEAAFFSNKLSRRRNLGVCYRCRGKGKRVLCKIRKEFKGPLIYRCAGFRLPTEAEWEFAARAGEVDQRYHKPAFAGKPPVIKNQLAAIAWFADNSTVVYQGGWPCPSKKSLTCGPQIVGTRLPNKLGLYDILGNVYEWTHDVFGAYQNKAQKDPAGPEDGFQRVLRGCGWVSSRENCRIARRFWSSPSNRTHLAGFRLARSLWLAHKPSQ